MNWLNFFYNRPTHLKHPFGRGINASVSADEEELFNKSYEAFEDGSILDAYEYFFKSLINFTDKKSNENIIITKEDSKLSFEIFQGSAKVKGYVNENHLYAHATIIKNSDATVAIKRYLLERNYQLTYASYFSDDESVKLKIYFDNTTATPQKIFFPIREIALNADFDKEYLKSEFKDITLQETSHIQKLSEDELKTKYQFLHLWIDALEKKIPKLPTNDNAGMQAFLYLNLLFKIDYLLVPKCDIYQKISKKIQLYFNDDSAQIEAKNDELQEYVDELKKISFDDFGKKFYNAKYTFNQMEKTPHEEIANFITESQTKIRWYKNNRYTQIIPTIYSYIAFYILYNYGLNPVSKMLMHMLVEIQNPDFFEALQYPVLYDKERESFNKKAIVSKIDEIISTHKNQYKSLESFADELNFSSLNEFNNSFLTHYKHLNFEEI